MTTSIRPTTVVAQTAVWILAILLAANSNTYADVTATANVPNGTTNFGGLIEWTLAEPGEPPVAFEIDVFPDMTGNNIISNMGAEVVNTSGFDPDVAGNVMTVTGVGGNLGTSPGEVDMTWEVVRPPGPGVSHPNFPLVNAPSQVPYASLSIFIAAPDGSSTQVGERVETEILAMDLVARGHIIFSGEIMFMASDTTDDINRRLDGELRRTQMPEGIEYFGLNNGFPTFVARDGFEAFSVRMYARTTEDPGFNVGFVYQDGAEAICAGDGTLIEGFGETGDFNATCGSDDSYWAAHGASLFFQIADPVVQFELTATVPAGFGGGTISVDIEASKQSELANLNLRALLFNFTTGNYVSLPGIMPLATTDAVQNFALPGGSDPADFIEPGTNEVRLLLQTIQTSGLPNVRTQLDEVLFNFE